MLWKASIATKPVTLFSRKRKIIRRIIQGLTRMKKVSIMALGLIIASIFALPFHIQATKSNPSSTLPWSDWTHYHNYTEIFNTLSYLNNTYPNIVDVFSIGKSWLGRDIYCVRLTNETITFAKPKVLFVGYHHARERISAELPLYFIVEAARGYGVNKTLTRMLDFCEIYVVVALNVDAFDAVEANEWQRKNVHPFDEDQDGLLDEDPPDDEDQDGFIEYLEMWNGTAWEFVQWEGIDGDGDGLLNEDWVGGVDLNRNYGYAWNESCDSGSLDPYAEDYKGPSPFSEPETKAIRDLSLNHDFKYAISFHSGDENIVYPWGHTMNPTPHDNVFREIARDLSELVRAPYMQAGTWYTTSGVWDDWMYGNRSTFAFTCEIFTNNSAWQYEPGPYPNSYWWKGISQFFNPNPSEIQTVTLRWMPVFTYISNRAINEFYAHDIAVVNVTPSKTIVGQGYCLSINVTVQNQGRFAETFNVTVYANTSGTDIDTGPDHTVYTISNLTISNMTVVGTQKISLEAGGSTTLLFVWNTTGVNKHHYVIIASLEIVPEEIDIEDNTLVDGDICVTRPGDVNGNMLIDIYDIAAICGAYGARKDDSQYDPNLDINGDGKIDIYDVVIACTNYGKTDP